MDSTLSIFHGLTNFKSCLWFVHILQYQSLTHTHTHSAYRSFAFVLCYQIVLDIFNLLEILDLDKIVVWLLWCVVTGTLYCIQNRTRLIKCSEYTRDSIDTCDWELKNCAPNTHNILGALIEVEFRIPYSVYSILLKSNYWYRRPKRPQIIYIFKAIIGCIVLNGQ